MSPWPKRAEYRSMRRAACQALRAHRPSSRPFAVPPAVRRFAADVDASYWKDRRHEAMTVYAAETPIEDRAKMRRRLKPRIGAGDRHAAPGRRSRCVSWATNRGREPMPGTAAGSANSCARGSAPRPAFGGAGARARKRVTPDSRCGDIAGVSVNRGCRSAAGVVVLGAAPNRGSSGARCTPDRDVLGFLSRYAQKVP